ncbi:hypothetical protein PFICI_08369 [Pestalotiopsis fici W106-1]|uniref:Methyltransferase domain-containing protein n=1 Tax=Pestalotiopsis fici (strain W106-1 / CGMCC3.15140) TaxID=1229662 RepID=W3X457_PESFW|nr:uncharacterized protein PFICI_08369 [Pestalotiopsis fici W106-1]ETS80840.1 hypothetical protein PFICI_08369 [Pestalotiopsis fici W106-1]
MDIFMPVASTYRPSIQKQRQAQAQAGGDGNKDKTDNAERQAVDAPGRAGSSSAAAPGKTRIRSKSRSRSKSRTRTRKGLQRRVRRFGHNDSDSESNQAQAIGGRGSRAGPSYGDVDEQRSNMAQDKDTGRRAVLTPTTPSSITTPTGLREEALRNGADDPASFVSASSGSLWKKQSTKKQQQKKGRGFSFINTSGGGGGGGSSSSSSSSSGAFSSGRGLDPQRLDLSHSGASVPSGNATAVASPSNLPRWGGRSTSSSTGQAGGHTGTTCNDAILNPVAPPEPIAPFTTTTTGANTTSSPHSSLSKTSSSSDGRISASQQISQHPPNPHPSAPASVRARAASLGASVAGINRQPAGSAATDVSSSFSSSSAPASAVVVAAARGRINRDIFPSSLATAAPTTNYSARQSTTAIPSRLTAHGSRSAALASSDSEPLAATPSPPGAALLLGLGAGAGAGILPPDRGAQRRHSSNHYAAMLSDAQSALPTKSSNSAAAYRRTGSVSSASVSGPPHLHRTGIMTSSENLPPSSHEGSVSASNLSATSNLALKNRVNVSPKPLVVRNGRTYIHDDQLPYPLPVDLAELHRQSLRTLLLFQLFGGPIISDAFASKPPQRILEVGCGSGFWSMMCHRYFAQHGHGGVSFTGIDIVPLCGTGPDPNSKPDKDMNWRFVQHDMRRTPWPFQDGEFDLVMVKDMSCAAPGQFSQIFMDEYLRLLRPGGVLEIWETDMSMRMLRPHVPATSTAATAAAAPPIPATSAAEDSESGSEDEDDATRLGVYVVSANTPLSAPLNQFLVEYNGWLSKALDKRFLSAVPCTMIGPMLLQEDGLIEVRSKRMAVPLSEVRWEREGVGGVVTKDGKSYIDSMKGKGKASDHKGGKGGKSLTAAQAAIRRTALETSVGLIQALEPMLRDVSGKSQDEWDGWTGKMMNDLLRDGGTSWGECLEIGAWSARRKN